MKKFLFLLALPLFGQTAAYIGATGDYAKSLGYNPAPTIVALVQGTRSWTEINAGPLDKTTVAGGAQMGAQTQIGIARIGETWLTGALDAQEEISPLWHKTTLRVGPGARRRFSDGTQIWGIVQKNFITPNGGEIFSGGVQVERGRFIALLSLSAERFDQPFTTPVQRGLWGIDVSAGIGLRIGGGYGRVP